MFNIEVTCFYKNQSTMLTEPYSPMLKIERLITQNNFVPDFLITDIIVLILLLIFY